MNASISNNTSEQSEPPTHDQDEREFAEEADSLWCIVFSPLVWVFHFLGCYIVTAIVCTKMPEADSISELRWFILCITLASLAGIAVIGWRSWNQWGFVEDGVKDQYLPTEEHRHEFLAHASFLLSIVSFIGVCYVAIPSMFLDSCQ
ncbi:hypothetical protein ACUNV4_16145 [Granulosicoccus sp. 3-233]|uniref:hypothetical protein n=1 Tax=Granulosicoccus sp. 3-233 TaxID=3417969 RepID=UPI003D346300